VESQELGDLGAVGRILVNTELEVLREGGIEFVEVLFVFGNFADNVQRLLDEVLSDDLDRMRSARSIKRYLMWPTFRILFC